MTIIYGFHPVREALRSRPHEVDRVMVGSGRKGGRENTIRELCQRRDIELVRVPESELRRLADGVHNGFVAELSGHGEDKAKPSAADPELIVLLEDIEDPRNLGAILRVCEGAGVGRVLVRDRGSAPISAVAKKAAAGANEWLEVERIPNTAAALKRLRNDGFWAYGADADGDPPWKVDLTGKIVICFGGEEKGLRQLSRRECDGLIGLPMRGRVGSLNVSAAAAALVYEAVRQRLLQADPESS